MAQLFDIEKGVATDVPEAQASEAISSGRFLPPKGKLNVVSANGEPQTIDAEGAQEAISKYGYRLETEQETATRKYGNSELTATGAAALRGATLGLSDAALVGSGLAKRETLKGLEVANPKVSLAGEAGGALASLLIPGEGEANVAKLAGKLGQLAERGTASALGKGLLGRLVAKGAAGAVEGSLYGAGRAVSEATLDDQQLTAEKLLSGVGVGGLVGLGGGVGLGVLGEAGKQALVLGKKAVGGINAGSLSDAVEEFAAGRAAKAAGAERGTINKLRGGEDQAKEIGRDLLDLDLVSAGKSQAEIREGVKSALKEHGEKIGAALDAADEATGGKAFDMQSFVKQARDEIMPQLERDPALKAQARKVGKMLEDYEALDGVGFREANELKSSLQDTINFTDAKATTKPVKRLQRLFDDQIESQLGAAGQDVGAYQEAGRLYGNLKEAAKWGKNQAASATGNGLLGLRDVIFASHGGPSGVAMALGSKLARERGNQVLADIANRVANSEVLQRVAGSFSKTVSGVLQKSPDAFGSYGGILANAAARGPEDLFATHATLAQMDPNYVNTMAKAGFAPESPEETGAALRRAGSLNMLDRAVAAHDAQINDRIKSFMKASPAEMRAGLGGAEKREALTRTAAEVAQLAGNPQALMERMKLGGLLADDAPGTGTAMATAATKAVQFLHDKAPQPPTPGLVPALEKPWQATNQQLDTFGRYVDAVHNPTGVLDDLRRGNVSKEAVEALQAVYPRLADDIRARLLTHLAETNERLSYRQRVALAPLLGDQVGLSAGARAVLQQAHGAAQAHEAAKQAAPGVAAQKRQMASTQTQSQRIEGRGAA